MNAYGDSWRLMTASLRLITIHDSSWWLQGGSRQFMTDQDVHDDIWQLHDSSCRFMMARDNSWQLMTIHYGSWPFMTIPDVWLFCSFWITRFDLGEMGGVGGPRIWKWEAILGGGGGLEESIMILPMYRDPIGSNNTTIWMTKSWHYLTL